MHIFGHPHHRCDNPWEGATPREIEVREMLRHIIANQEKIMSALSDAMAALTTTVTNALTEMDALLAKIANSGTSDADAAAAIASAQALSTSIQAEVDKAKAAVPA